MKWLAALGCLAMAGCGPRATGLIELAAGTTVLHREMTLPDGAHDLEIRGYAGGSTLRAAADFQGRALIYSRGARNLKLTGFRIEGDRTALEQPEGLPTNDTPFARYYRNNGIVVESANGVRISDVALHEVANYAVIVCASTDVRIERVSVEDSGSLSPTKRNNASGGILLEEGTRDFAVRDCIIRRVRGNGIWTHSFYRSPRNADGVIEGNVIEDVARDAIQAGHATNTAVRGNRGRRIGYPTELVDVRSWAVPAAIDTAGNVDKSTYADNHFEDIDGKCMDLDGFHDGYIRDNSCISRGGYDEYPWAQFGIVFNNASPDMQSVNVVVTGNVIDGAGYGGLYLLGSHHAITGNRFVNLNRNGCDRDRTRARCDTGGGDAGLLRAGIYLVGGAARPAHTADNQISGNEVEGFGMRKYCVEGAPGVLLAANRIAGNRCSDPPGKPKVDH